jgi:hypothetical protein
MQSGATPLCASSVPRKLVMAFVPRASVADFKVRIGEPD